jgi:hypothetical protein
LSRVTLASAFFLPDSVATGQTQQSRTACSRRRSGHQKASKKINSATWQVLDLDQKNLPRISDEECSKSNRTWFVALPEVIH